MPGQPVTARTIVCAVTGVTKHYGGVQALDGVDFAAEAGTIHAIVGQNGAGKSTLMKILAGAEQADAGELLVDGAPARFDTVLDANLAGVAIVFQELSLFPDLDVLSNLFPHAGRGGWRPIDRGALEKQAAPVLEQVGLDLDLETPVDQLTLGEQQLVEIAKAVLAQSKVLILDEPNSALNATETDRLFKIIRGLAERDVSVIFISHRLEEVFEIADDITIIRNGRVIESKAVKDTSIREVVRLMVGGDAPDETVSESTSDMPPVAGGALVLSDVCVDGHAEEINLTINPGEIVGLAGLEGSGAVAVLNVIFGAVPLASGSITLPNGESAHGSIASHVKSGIAYVPADRRVEGLSLDNSVVDNMALVTAGALGMHGFKLRRNALLATARARGKELGLHCDDYENPVSSLSGGNQQKVVIGKWLEAAPQVVLLNDPTRGVDIGAKREIYRIVSDLARNGHIVLFVSSELTEYSQLCHRIAVFYRRKITAEIHGPDATTARLLTAVNTGVVDQIPIENTKNGGSI